MLDPGGYNMPIAEYRALFQVWRDRALTIRVAYSLCAPRRGHELEDLQAMTEGMPMGFGDDWLRFNGIGENVTWGMYNNEQPTEAQKRAALSRAAMGRAARPDRDLPLAQQSLGSSSARRAGAHEPRDAGRIAALVDRASQRRLAGQASRA